MLGFLAGIMVPTDGDLIPKGKPYKENPRRKIQKNLPQRKNKGTLGVLARIMGPRDGDMILEGSP